MSVYCVEFNLNLAVTLINSKELGRPALWDINLEFETALKFYNLVVRNCHIYIFTDFILLLLMHDCELASNFSMFGLICL